MHATEIGWISLIVFLPLMGALFNALFGKRFGKGAVRAIGVGMPLAAFALSLAVFFAFYVADFGPPGRGVVAFRGSPSAISRINAQLTSSSHSGRASWVSKFEEDGKVLRIIGPKADDPAFSAIKLSFGNVEFGPASEVASPRSYKADLGEWISVGNLKISFRFLIDRLTIVLLLIITGVGSLIHIYSTGYMAGETDGTFARFFTYLNLFLGAMLVLVMGDNMLMLFIGWEGVGLCSYLLIGFGYESPHNAACGTKAFVVNRIGDVGFVLGTLTLLVAIQGAFPGEDITLEFAQLNKLGDGAVLPSILGGACILLFLGATGKSAQIPLHLWLPDAMAGPTPVSALIHAATMVTAGIYMIARLNNVFLHAELPIPGVGPVPVLGIVAVVGALTAFFAGCAAIGQDDIKKVLAYSTVSQLGYMFIGVGTAAMGSAVFHLVTHAFFKALLFLGAGAVIHATHTQSMREMGGLRRAMPTTFWTMLIGGLALAGFPLFSGFFSKDMILYEALVRYNSANASVLWGAIYFLGVGTGMLTAIYTTRLICMTFFGEYRGKGQPHEAPTSMTFPLIVLAVLAVLGGLLGLPALVSQHWGELLPHHYLRSIFAGVERTAAYAGRPNEVILHGLELKGLGVGSLAAIAGVFLGYRGWGRRRPSEIYWETVREGFLGSVRRTLEAAWYYDQLVNKQVVQPAVKYMSAFLWRNVDDAAIDRGLVDGFGRVAVQLSLFIRVFQNGRVSRYAAYVVFGAITLTALVAIFSIPSVLRAVQHVLPS